MAPRIIECEQGSPEWYAARLGIPTASMFKAVKAEGRGGKKDSATRDDYMRKLAGEICTGEPHDSFSNAHMERGGELEPIARAAYERNTFIEVRQVGFVRNHGRVGASPDGLISHNGGLELKCPTAHVHIKWLKADRCPPEHYAQVQGNMWVCEREWWDFFSFRPRLPPLLVTVERDEEYIKILAAEVRKFNGELSSMVRFLGGTMPEELEEAVAA